MQSLDVQSGVYQCLYASERIFLPCNEQRRGTIRSLRGLKWLDFVVNVHLK